MSSNALGQFSGKSHLIHNVKILAILLITYASILGNILNDCCTQFKID